MSDDDAGSGYVAAWQRRGGNRFRDRNEVVARRKARVKTYLPLQDSDEPSWLVDASGPSDPAGVLQGSGDQEVEAVWLGDGPSSSSSNPAEAIEVM